MTDSEAVALAQSGDESGWNAIYEKHHARVENVCRRMLNGKNEEVEDLTQEVFLQIFRKLNQFRGDAQLSTWIHRITVNTLLMKFRRKAYPEVSLDELAERRVESGGLSSEIAELAREDTRLSGAVDRIALTRALALMPKGYRTTLVMTQIYGFEHQEAARLLGRTVGNSKSQLHKGKIAMRLRLA